MHIQKIHRQYHWDCYIRNNRVSKNINTYNRKRKTTKTFYVARFSQSKLKYVREVEIEIERSICPVKHAKEKPAITTFHHHSFQLGSRTKEEIYFAVSVSSTTSCRARLIVSQLLFVSCKDQIMLPWIQHWHAKC